MHCNEELLREMELWPVWKRRDAAGAETISRPQAATEVMQPQRREVQKSSAALGGADWQVLKERVAKCAACGLCKQRKQAVFGVGNESAPWLFIGEGPGADEDAQGEPFVGQAGKLLDSMLAAIRLQRGREVYITNVVKCRPPGNRVPTAEEAAACAPYLDRQIDLISPRLIVALGKTAATRLLGIDVSLASLRGKLHRYRGFPVIITYHPAYLLRNLQDKAKAWEDLVFARQTMVGLLQKT
jgi:uracil-DNA glycosylase family 4